MHHAILGRTLARIDEDPRGGPVRLIVNGRHRKPTGRWYSVKNRRAMPWEARAERDLCVLCEADADVASFLVQPHRLTMVTDDGGTLVYYPDVRIDRADGRVEIVQVKRDDEAPDDAYRAKLDLAGRVYAGIGWSHRVMTEGEIRRQPAFANASAICLDAAVSVPLDDVARVVLRFDDGAARATYGDLVALLGGGPRGIGRLHALVVQRVVAVDLSAPLSPEAPVRLASGVASQRSTTRC